MELAWDCIDKLLPNYIRSLQYYRHKRFLVVSGGTQSTENRLKPCGVGVQRLIEKKRVTHSFNVVDKLFERRIYTANSISVQRCQCDNIAFFQNYIQKHVASAKEEKTCSCKKVCQISELVKCSVARNVCEWICQQLNLTKLDDVYCTKHFKILNLFSDTARMVRHIFKDSSCVTISDDLCYHEIIEILYEKRESRDLYDSNLHQQLAAWLHYNEHRTDCENRVVISRGRPNGSSGPMKIYDIYYGYPVR